MAQHKPPIGAEAVIYNTLAQAISTGPLTWEAEVRSDSEKGGSLDRLPRTRPPAARRLSAQ